MLARLLPVAALAAAALTASGCGKSVAISSWVPPEADIAGARRLVVTDAYGRDSSVAAVTDFAIDAARTNGWFDEVERSFDRLETDGVDAWLGRDDVRGDSLYVRLDVLEDSAVVSSDERVVVDDLGNQSVVVDDHLVAHTLVAVTVADRRGVLVLEREVEGVHEQSGAVTDDDIAFAQDEAARAAVAGALALVTPTPITVQVPLDDRDDRAFDLAVRGVDGSDDDARAAVAALEDLDTAAAVYNAAVVSDDVGDTDAAVDLYEDACARVDAATFCDDVLAGARQRQANEAALGL